MPLPQPNELIVSRLGPSRFSSSLQSRGQRFIDDASRILASADVTDLQPFLATGQPPPAFELADPRSEIFFNPSTVTCGIVTCGGICPGLNDVIRSVVRTLTFGYGAPRVLGFRYGYAGLSSKSGHVNL